MRIKDPLRDQPLKRVSKKEFFDFINSSRENIHPRPEADASYWYVVYPRRLVGKSTPGWKREGPVTHFLVITQPEPKPHLLFLNGLWRCHQPGAAGIEYGLCPAEAYYRWKDRWG